MFSDYTKENIKYVEWNTFCLILNKLKQKECFLKFIKISLANYYDFVRVIVRYLTKSDKGAICLQSTPIPLLEIGPLIKLYHQDGKIIKLTLINQYDPKCIEGSIDCYIHEFN
eukprot:GHVR01025230.1.p1 GENE.GHVR01025230.1~~GHVR01025230.1.p1  ORF type:complete len:113 (+),score=0.34 GHVR01025230.1:1218-1556(+)